MFAKPTAHQGQGHVRLSAAMPWWADEAVLLARVEADARRHLTDTEWHEAWGRGGHLSAVMALQLAQTVLTGLEPSAQM